MHGVKLKEVIFLICGIIVLSTCCCGITASDANDDSKEVDQLDSDSEEVDQLDSDSEEVDQLGTDSEEVGQLGSDSEEVDQLDSDSEESEVDQLGTDSEEVGQLGSDSEEVGQLGRDSEEEIKVRLQRLSAKKWLDYYNKEMGKREQEEALLDYASVADLHNDELREKAWDYHDRFDEWIEKRKKEAHAFDRFNLTSEQRRLFNFITIDIAPKDKNDSNTLYKLEYDVGSIFDNGVVCKQNKTRCLYLSDLAHTMAKSRDYNELLWAWKGWRDVTGKKARSLFTQVVELQNKAARDNGYADMGEFWRIDGVDDKDFDKETLEAWTQLEPFYKQIHAYVRWKLSKIYPGKIQSNGLIPAHILGNMWAQTWQNIGDIVMPYPNATATDITDELKRQNITARKMFKIAEHFFKSIGLYKMTDKFWKESHFVKPKNQHIDCHAAAWDMKATTRDDFRIMMCTRINTENFRIVHHEMGHIQYYMAYSGLPPAFRYGANTGFHEAVGDTIALSVMSPKHLHAVGFLPDYDGHLDNKTLINYLMKEALGKIVFLPYALTVENWRWSVFNDSVTTEHYNQAYWNLRKRFQGLAPPVERTESDLDPLAKYHVAHSVPYLRYYISFIMQYQFHKSLCREARQTGPIYNCDIYKSKNAGRKFLRMLKLGQSVPWHDAMKVLDKNAPSKLDAGALLEYFKPLQKWLEKEITKHNITVGWI